MKIYTPFTDIKKNRTYSSLYEITYTLHFMKIFSNGKFIYNIFFLFLYFRYLIDLDLLSYADDHWIPYYLFCTPCLLNYNIIGKVETMHRDQIFAIHSANLQQIIKPRWQHRTAPVTHNMASNMARIYFAQLTRSETEKLYQKYQLDFELFDYDIKEYLKYTLDNKNY